MIAGCVSIGCNHQKGECLGVCMTKMLSDAELCALSAKLAAQLEQRLNKHRHDSPLILETIGAAQSLAGLVDNALCEARLLDEEAEHIADRETSNQAIR